MRKRMEKESEIKRQEITRKEAIKKIGTYSKYAALTALGTYLILHPKSAQAASPPMGSKSPPSPPTGFAH
ncbi:MAG: hypothetical protein JKY02_09410 [Flavobacteriaceae bacterium]|nr:hypothetical protein [Flavobacteriaceae bacterium]